MKNVRKGLIVILSAVLLLVTMLASALAAPALDMSGGMIISVPAVTNNFQGEMPSFTNTGTGETQFDYAVQRTLQYHNNDGNANKYLSIKSKEEAGTVLTSNNQYIGFNYGTSLGDCLSNKYAFIHNDYAVFDFDICADSYVDANGYFTTEQYDSLGNKNSLSYPANMLLSFYYRVGSSGGVCVIGDTPRLETTGNTESGYFLAYNGGGVNKIPLSDKINEWTHVTMVYEIDNSVNYFAGENYTGALTIGEYDAETVAAIMLGEHETYKSFSYNLSKTKLHIYADGEYMGTDTTVLYAAIDEYDFWRDATVATAGGIEKAGLYQARMSVKNAGKRFSYGLDNFAYNLYRNNYTGDLANQIENTLEKPIYFCNDVVYNGDYDAPDGTPAKAVLYNDVEPDPTLTVLDVAAEYDVAVGALKNATTQQYALLSHGVENYYPKTEFYVCVPEGETFSTAGDSGYEVSKTPTVVKIGGVEYNFYFVSKAQTTYNIVWYEDMEMIKTLQESVLIDGSEIVYRGQTPNTEILDNNKHRVFEGWKYVAEYDEDLNPVWVDFDFTVIDETVKSVIANCCELSIAPAYVEKTAYYAITSSVGVVEEYVYDNANNLSLDIKAGKSVKLFVDIEELYAENILQSNGKTYIAIPQDAKVVIDLNGHLLNLNSITYEYAFLLSKNTSLSIRSSVKGGTIVAKCGIARGNEDGRCKLFLGAEGDLAGENAYLTVQSKSIFGTQPNRNNYAHTVGIYGVNYYSDSATSAVNQVGMMTNVEITNSIFYLSGEGGALFYTNRNGKGAINATVTNSTIVSTKKDGSPDYIIRDLGNYTADTAKEPTVPVYQAIFDNCKLYGTLTPTDNALATLDEQNRGKVYLAGGTKVSTTEELPRDVVLSAAAGNTLVPIDLSETVTLYTPTGKVDMEIAYRYQDQYDIGYKISLNAFGGFFFDFEISKGLASAVYTKIDGEALVGVESGDKVIYTIPIPTASASDVTIYLDTDGDELVEITANLSTYFKSAFKHSATDAERTLIVNAANYANELYKFANKGADFAEYKAFIEDNKDMLILPTDTAPEASVEDTSVISAVQLIISDASVPAFAFTKSGEGVVSIKYADKTVVCEEREILGTTYFVAEDMPLYDMANSFEIYVGEGKIGEYGILNYIDSTDNLIASALYGYIISAEAVN